MAALRQAGVAVPRAASVLARGDASGRDFLLRIASALAERDPPVTLVLHEFHCVTNPELLGGLAYMLRSARPGLRLVTASRSNPPLPLHRYRLTRDLAEIRASELAFTVPEAAQLMSQHGVTLPTASLADLTERSEGWAAGLRMAAMSMASHPDPEQFVKSLVAEDGGARKGVRAAGRAGLVSVPQLFRTALQLKLRREEPQAVADLRRQAASWCQRNGMLADAVSHATRAADRELAARIVADGLAIGQFIGPGRLLPADAFHPVPEDDASHQLLLAAATVALSEARDQGTEARSQPRTGASAGRPGLAP